MWTQEDIECLREHWGCIGGKAALAKRLGRSVNAINVRAGLLHLGPWLEGGEAVLLKHIVQSVTGEYESSAWAYHAKRWVREGLPAVGRRVEAKRFRVIKIETFWRWAKAHRDMLDFSRFEEGSLGPEPEWAKEKRKIDRANLRCVETRQSEWSVEEMHLLRGLCERGATWAEIERALHRSKSGIAMQIWKLALPLPTKAKARPWSERELERLREMAGQGYADAVIARELDRSAWSVHGRLMRLRREDGANADAHV